LTIFCRYRDSKDIENNEIFTHCEKNELSFKIYDLDNEKIPEDIIRNFSEIESSIVTNWDKIFILDGSIYHFYNFFEVLENKLLTSKKTSMCGHCGFKLNSTIFSRSFSKMCPVCKENKDGIITQEKIRVFSEQVKKVKVYNFIKKLGLN
jgi:hypothetical protein